ncbi:MAG: universal stress protein, partial [Propionibacteriaceae bacterium]|nr:universal stress protein [Propionibacteriaceae bacterium]
MEQKLPITVGFDGSEFATAALRKGLWLAQRLDLPLRIIRAWTISNAPRPTSWEPGFIPPIEDFAAAMTELSNAQLSPVLAEYPQVEVAIEVPHGAAGRELIRASEASSMIVVGT